MTEAAIFMPGNSLAVRLPTSFRRRGKSVEIFRRGIEVVLREKRQTLVEVLQDLPPISPEDAEAFEQALEHIRSESAPPRDWDALTGSGRQR